ncbi:MAG: hypothetical protein AAGN46_02800 [Acidobacteriota bacterium]
MAVHQRDYRPYGSSPPARGPRWLVLPRFALADLTKSKLLIAFFALCLIPPLYYLTVVYLRHSAAILQFFPGLDLERLISIDADFFAQFARIQAGFGFFLTLFVGPGLVSRDLANNALPLYLARPLSRVEYVVGRLTVLILLLSLISWIPGLIVVALQAGYVDGWLGANLGIPIGLVGGAWMWMITLGLLALAVSAWVRWKPIAALVIFLFLASGTFLATLINGLFGTSYGKMVDLGAVLSILWTRWIGGVTSSDLPTAAALVSLVTFLSLFVALLALKIKPYRTVS